MFLLTSCKDCKIVWTEQQLIVSAPLLLPPALVRFPGEVQLIAFKPGITPRRSLSPGCFYFPGVKAVRSTVRDTCQLMDWTYDMTWNLLTLVVFCLLKAYCLLFSGFFFSTQRRKMITDLICYIYKGVTPQTTWTRNMLDLVVSFCGLGSQCRITVTSLTSVTSIPRLQP